MMALKIFIVNYFLWHKNCGIDRWSARFVIWSHLILCEFFWGLQLLGFLCLFGCGVNRVRRRLWRSDIDFLCVWRRDHRIWDIGLGIGRMWIGYFEFRDGIGNFLGGECRWGFCNWIFVSRIRLIWNGLFRLFKVEMIFLSPIIVSRARKF